MEFKFSALSQKADEQGHEAAERKMFEADKASEHAGRGEPMASAQQGASKGPEGAEPVAEANATVEGAAEAASEPNQENAAEASAEGAIPAVVEEQNPEVEAIAKAATPEESVSPPEKAADDPFAALLQLSAGKRGADDVPVASTPSTDSGLSILSNSVAAEDESTEADIDDLAGAVMQGVKEQQTGNKPGAHQDGSPQSPVAAAVPAAVGSGQFSTTVGGLVGRAVGEVVATPFIALSTAARHLKQRFGSLPMSVIPPAPLSAAHSLAASTAPGMSSAILNTLETITQWKCERIEKAASEVAKTASELTKTEEFVVWEDKLRKAAAQQDKPLHNVVARMHEDESLSGLKEGMDSLWASHPDKVTSYRKASEDFVRNINGVIKEFPNSDDTIKERVANAMKDVEEKTQLLPGYGQDVGEYQRTIAERVRDMAKIIAEFVRALVTKLTGRAPSNSELTVG